MSPIHPEMINELPHDYQIFVRPALVIGIFSAMRAFASAAAGSLCRAAAEARHCGADEEKVTEVSCLI